MPTIKQLPVATSVAGTDALPVSQNGFTRSVTLGTLLSGTQPTIALASGNLLGRVSAGSGGPESIALATGVAFQSSGLIATGQDHVSFAQSTALLPGDEVVVNSGAAPKRLAATQLRSLFTAGSGVQIDSNGVISSTNSSVAATPATTTVLGGVKAGVGLAVAADGTLSVADVSAATVTPSGATVSRTVSARLGDVVSLKDFGAAGYVPGSGGDDLPAFTAALTRLTAVGGGRLVIPSGTYRVSGSIIPPVGSGLVPMEIVGQGDATVIVPSAVMAGVMTVDEGNILLADLALSNISNLAGAGLVVTKALDNSRCEFDRLTFSSFTKGVWVQNGDVLHFNRPRFIACGTAFAIDNGMLNSSIAEMYALGGNGIDIAVPTTQQPEGLHVIGGKILPSTTGSFGVRVRSGLEISFSGVVVDQLAAAGANGFLVDSSGFAVRAIKIASCWTGIKSGSTGTGSGIKLVGAASEQIHIDQHTFDSHGAYGLEVNGGAGVVLDLSVAHCRFKNNTSGDVSLQACRAIFLGCDLMHATNSVVTAGTQVQVIGVGNRFAANPQLGTIPGGFYAANTGNTNDSLDGISVGVNVRAPVMAANSLDILTSGIFRGSATFASGLSVSAGGMTVTGNVGLTGLLSATGTISGSNFGNGSGDPTGAVAATPGTVYQRLAASGSLLDHELWVKSSAADTTGWHAIATQDYVSRNSASMLPNAPVTALYGGTGGAGTAQVVIVGANLSLVNGVLSGSGAGGTTNPPGGTAGQLQVNNGASGFSGIAVSGDGSITSSGVLTVTKTSGTAFGTAATLNVGTAAGTVAAGNDARFVGAVTPLVIDGASIPGSTASPYAMQTGDYVVNVNKSTGAATALTLPVNPTVGRTYYIVDGRGDAGTNSITISAQVGGNISGASTFVANANYDGITLLPLSATVWRLV